MRSEQGLRGEGVFDLDRIAACSGLMWANFGFRRQEVGGQAAADPHLPTYRGGRRKESNQTLGGPRISIVEG